MANTSYRQAMRQFLDGSGLTGVRGPNTDRELALAESAFKGGAKFVAKMAVEVGQILEKNSDILAPKDILTLRSVFATIKEIQDE